MKKVVKMFAVATLMLAGVSAQAADRKVMLPLADAMSSSATEGKLNGGVKFYFGTTPTPPVLGSFGVDKTSQKANAFNKSDEVACNRAFLSAMIRLQKRALEIGANAVIKIVSNYQNVEMSSTQEFECHAGGLMAGVALKGEFVKIDENK